MGVHSESQQREKPQNMKDTEDKYLCEEISDEDEERNEQILEKTLQNESNPPTREPSVI